MKEILEYSTAVPPENLTEMAFAMQEAAIAHSKDLNIDHDRMFGEFGCLWMLVRYEIRLERLPVGSLRVETFLRSPNAAFSLRDFSFFDAQGHCGEAVQTWVVVDAAERKIRPLSDIPPLLEGPVHKPERTTRPRRFRLPEGLETLGFWEVSPQEIDDNGHLNNVAYVRAAAAYAPMDCLSLEVSFERECFLGERLTVKGLATEEGYFVQICKESGEESFRALFRKEA